MMVAKERAMSPRTFAALLLAALASPMALAATASASLGNIRITVIDLDPRDRVAAGYRFEKDAPQSSVGVALAGAGQPLSNRARRSAPGWLAPMSASPALGSAGGRGEVAARRIAASGSARAAGDHFI